ncbi:MAG TPA: PQQ-binding-like beta-propeller repeat protein [Thermomicrobiales bacterium]|jgi:outer membrane protein assembly factor BamB|nr:PQQ-binding-like beta-propeller repeat protein [Thermomicrobiales bacterium]
MDDSTLSRRRLVGTAGVAGLALAGVGLSGNQFNRANAQDEQAGPEGTPEPLGGAVPEEFDVETNWAGENYDLAATRDVRGTSISTENVDQLGLAWTYGVTGGGNFGALTANPTIVGDNVYIQDASANVYALNKTTGEELWVNRYDDRVPSGGPNGIAAAYGLLFTTLGGLGDVLALRPEDGSEVWRTNIQGPLNEGITTYPAVHDNIVWVSTIPGSSDGFYQGGQRGVIHALNAASGEVLWYFDTTTDNLWGNPTINSGGGFWHPPSFDADGRAYVPVANPAPYPGVEGFPWTSSRPGDNLYTNSVLKMDPATAQLDWYYQVLPHDVFDLDNHLTPILATIDGRDVAIASGKHGIVVSLDRETGEPIWSVPVGTHQNDDRREFEEDESVEVFPGTLGGVETQMAYSEEYNVLVCPIVELGSTYIGTGFDPDAPFDFTQGTGLLTALNPSDGSILWEVELATPPYAAATICNDVVFTAGLDGVLLGFNVTDGTEVFRYQSTAGINAQLAVSGDLLFVPSGGPLLPSSAQGDDVPETPSFSVVVLSLSGDTSATPQADGGTPDALPSPTEDEAGGVQAGSDDPESTPEA